MFTTCSHYLWNVFRFSKFSSWNPVGSGFHGPLSLYLSRTLTSAISDSRKAMEATRGPSSSWVAKAGIHASWAATTSPAEQLAEGKDVLLLEISTSKTCHFIMLSLFTVCAFTELLDFVSTILAQHWQKQKHEMSHVTWYAEGTMSNHSCRNSGSADSFRTVKWWAAQFEEPAASWVGTRPARLSAPSAQLQLPPQHTVGSHVPTSQRALGSKSTRYLLGFTRWLHEFHGWREMMFKK